MTQLHNTMDHFTQYPILHSVCTDKAHAWVLFPQDHHSAMRPACPWTRQTSRTNKDIVIAPQAWSVPANAQESALRAQQATLHSLHVSPMHMHGHFILETARHKAGLPRVGGEKDYLPCALRPQLYTGQKCAA